MGGDQGCHVVLLLRWDALLVCIRQRSYAAWCDTPIHLSAHNMNLIRNRERQLDLLVCLFLHLVSPQANTLTSLGLVCCHTQGCGEGRCGLEGRNLQVRLFHVHTYHKCAHDMYADNSNNFCAARTDGSALPPIYREAQLEKTTFK